MYRLRVKFGCGEQLKFISHLDLMRCWERALRRATLPIAYSEGFTPHPKFSLAAPLPVGVTGRGELLDLFFSDWVAPDTFRVQMKKQLPPGLNILETQPIGLTAASLQAQMQFAEYEVELHPEISRADLDQAIKDMLNCNEIPWQHVRDKVMRSYDLRPMIEHVWVMESTDNNYHIGMRLQCNSAGTGRPEQVAKALGFNRYPVSITRTSLIYRK